MSRFPEPSAHLDDELAVGAAGRELRLPDRGCKLPQLRPAPAPASFLLGLLPSFSFSHAPLAARLAAFSRSSLMLLLKPNMHPDTAV